MKLTWASCHVQNRTPLNILLVPTVILVAAEVMPKIIGRGKQKTLVKVLTTIRLSNEVITHFKASGKGWQSKIDSVLKEYVSKVS